MNKGSLKKNCGLFFLFKSCMLESSETLNYFRWKKKKKTGPWAQAWERRLEKVGRGPCAVSDWFKTLYSWRMSAGRGKEVRPRPQLPDLAHLPRWGWGRRGRTGVGDTSPSQSQTPGTTGRLNPRVNRLPTAGCPLWPGGHCVLSLLFFLPCGVSDFTRSLRLTHLKWSLKRLKEKLPVCHANLF